MVLRTIVVLLAILLTSTGCALFEPRVVQAEPLQITQPTLPREMDLKEPYFYVVNGENLDEFLKEINNQSGQTVFIAMTVADYELMAYNMQEIKRYVNEVGAVIVYYRTVTSPPPVE